MILADCSSFFLTELNFFPPHFYDILNEQKTLSALFSLCQLGDSCIMSIQAKVSIWWKI